MVKTDARGRKFKYGKWYPSEEAKKAFEPLSIAWSELRLRLETVSDEDLETMIESVDDFDQGNSWWATYEVSRALKHHLIGERKRREYLQELRDRG